MVRFGDAGTTQTPFRLARDFEAIGFRFRVSFGVAPNPF